MHASELKTIDYLGQALDLEARAKVTESQTTQRAMERAAMTLRKLHEHFASSNAVAQRTPACGRSGAAESSTAGTTEKV